MKILMVLTSHDQLGNTGNKTGFWLEEFASPYYHFLDNGADITLASPKGGRPPIDPTSTIPENETKMTKRLDQDSKAQAALSQTTKLSDIDYHEFDAVFYPGGHGPMWDLVKNKDSIQLIENFYKAGKPVVAVCHAPAALKNVMVNGEPLVKDKKITGFTNSEEEEIGLADTVPFLLEDELKKLGGDFQKEKNWKSFVVADGLLITGQNQTSSKAAAEKLIETIKSNEKNVPRSKDTLTGGASMNQ
jgi:putative intracellular protease/amidase